MTKHFAFVSLGFMLSVSGYAVCDTDITASGIREDDYMVTRMVSAKMNEVQSACMMVSADGGRVTLSGFALNDYEAKRAVALARSVSGVKSVRNEMVTMLDPKTVQAAPDGWCFVVNERP